MVTDGVTEPVDEVAELAAKYADFRAVSLERLPEKKAIALAADIRRMAAALSPPIKAGEAVPVAWRGKYRAEAAWKYFTHAFDGFDPDKYQLEPLYASPQPEAYGVRAGIVEAAAEVADVAADEQDVLAMEADESNFAAYRQGERIAKEIADAIRALSHTEQGETP